MSLHSHEPANASEQPAVFVPRFARAAIDAGASLVVGHGPHRLRGIELYKGGAILYSLGNFLYQSCRLDFRAANLLRRRCRTSIRRRSGRWVARESRRRRPRDEPAWWEGVLAVATLRPGSPDARFDCIPLDLGADKPQAERGMPRIADRAHELSASWHGSARLSGSGLGIRVEQGVGIVRGSSPSPRGL